MQDVGFISIWILWVSKLLQCYYYSITFSLFLLECKFDSNVWHFWMILDSLDIPFMLFTILHTKYHFFQIRFWFQFLTFFRWLWNPQKCTKLQLFQKFDFDFNFWCFWMLLIWGISTSDEDMGFAPKKRQKCVKNERGDWRMAERTVLTRLE